MVIQPNMSPMEVIKVWKNTIEVFKEYKVPLSEMPLRMFVEGNTLTILLQELNTIVGSSPATCIEGG